MRRLVPVVAAVLLLATFTPASAHYRWVDDALGDTYEADDTSGDPVSSRLDVQMVSFQDFEKRYEFFFFLIMSVDPSEICPTDGCGSDPATMGYLDIEFFRLKGDKITKPYLLRIRRSGEELTGLLSRGSMNKASDVVEVPVEMDAPNIFKVTIPRKYVKGQPKGKTIGWKTATVWWEDPAESEVCLADAALDFMGACVDRVPDTGYAEHKLRL